MVFNDNNSRTISWTWCFSALPYPTTVCLTNLGEYSWISSAARSATNKTTPRTWPSFILTLTFVARNASSKAHASGRCFAMTSSSPLHILSSRVENFRLEDARMEPKSMSEYFRPSPSTTPQPVVWLPGSIPSTRIGARVYQSLFFVLGSLWVVSSQYRTYPTHWTYTTDKPQNTKHKNTPFKPIALSMLSWTILQIPLLVNSFQRSRSSKRIASDGLASWQVS